ncbi:MAG: hypothetical protein JXD22_11095 [Sedimentisphaerales bacterium]|nr:hypothetical protein [Sedimentisphaerales bacterium]
MAVTSLSGGCRQYQYYNQADFVHADSEHLRFSRDKTWQIFFKTTFFYPVRDCFNPDRISSVLFGKELQAKNLTETNQVPDSSFYTNRNIAELSPEIIAQGPNQGPPPQGPFKILKIKDTGGSRGFLGKDSLGQKFLIKLDSPDYPELGSSASIIGSRIYWALGYNVPETYLITITGTGNERFDGQRAIASKFISGQIRGIYKFDWVSDRREFRAMKLAAAWLNDLDRSDNNNLAAQQGDLIKFYILDFNAALGSWQGKPKQSWQGCQYRWDIGKQFSDMLTVLTLGLWRVRPCGQGDPAEPKSLGYLPLKFDPDRWYSEKPNTAFNKMTFEDALWMARKIAQFTPAQIKAIVDQAQLTDPAAAEKLFDALLKRRAIIIQRFISQVPGPPKKP